MDSPIVDLALDESVQIIDDDAPKHVVPDVYKKFFKSSSTSGFLAIKPALGIGKLRVDIGSLLQEGGLKSHTETYVDAFLLASYLHSVAHGTAANTYKPNDKLGIPTVEGMAVYGGGMVDGQPVSRIFKVHHWSYDKGTKFDVSAFAWKCGHFKAKQSAQGAFIPTDMGNPISADFIKVTRAEMAEISYRVDLLMHGWAARNPEWMVTNK